MPKFLHICEKSCNFAGEMGKSVRNSINLILGIMVALLSGFGGQRLFAKCKPKPVKYGPKPNYERTRERKDALEQKTDSISSDTLIVEPTPPPYEPPVCKYGPPGGNW